MKLVNDLATIPTRGTPGSAGLDLYSCEEGEIDIMERKLIGTGIKVILPESSFGRIASRSGLSLNYDLDVCAGIVDQDYRGEIKVLLMNNGTAKYKYKVGDKIGQLIIQPYIHMQPKLDTDFDKNITQRNEKGFGSTDL